MTGPDWNQVAVGVAVVVGSLVGGLLIRREYRDPKRRAAATRARRESFDLLGRWRWPPLSDEEFDRRDEAQQVLLGRWVFPALAAVVVVVGVGMVIRGLW